MGKGIWLSMHKLQFGTFYKILKKTQANNAIETYPKMKEEV